MPAALFAIDAATGVVTVADGALDREAVGASLDITVTATSADGSTATQSFTIALNDVDEFDVSAPVDSERGGQRGRPRTPPTGTLVGHHGVRPRTPTRPTNAVTYSPDRQCRRPLRDRRRRPAW